MEKIKITKETFEHAISVIEQFNEGKNCVGCANLSVKQGLVTVCTDCYGCDYFEVGKSCRSVTCGVRHGGHDSNERYAEYEEVKFDDNNQNNCKKYNKKLTSGKTPLRLKHCLMGALANER